MKLGADISSTDRDVVRQTLTHTPMYDEAKGQMAKTLDGYKSNGEGWDFHSPGLLETMGQLTSGGERPVFIPSTPVFGLVYQYRWW